ncbi:MAG: enoyl-CoA hydratase [Ruegeria sp.]|uniref:enoyl-CoA hydratase n=1 Tax=Ruegeria sp. TaxID=1879320 RepID=UPI00349E7CA0
MKKLLAFVAEIGTIMYVGGILSHIVIGAINPHPAPETAEFIYNYKLQSAYILILPGLGLKILIDLIQFFGFGERAWWMRIKLAMTAFLTVNAFVFLVPMMPQLLDLAQASIPDGKLSDAFHAFENKEKMVGISNIVPLITEMVMGAFKPGITKAERAGSTSTT